MHQEKQVPSVGPHRCETRQELMKVPPVADGRPPDTLECLSGQVFLSCTLSFSTLVDFQDLLHTSVGIFPGT